MPDDVSLDLLFAPLLAELGLANTDTEREDLVRRFLLSEKLPVEELAGFINYTAQRNVPVALSITFVGVQLGVLPPKKVWEIVTANIEAREYASAAVERLITDEIYPATADDIASALSSISRTDPQTWNRLIDQMAQTADPRGNSAASYCFVSTVNDLLDRGDIDPAIQIIERHRGDNVGTSDTIGLIAARQIRLRNAALASQIATNDAEVAKMLPHLDSTGIIGGFVAMLEIGNAHYAYRFFGAAYEQERVFARTFVDALKVGGVDTYAFILAAITHPRVTEQNWISFFGGIEMQTNTSTALMLDRARQKLFEIQEAIAEAAAEGRELPPMSVEGNLILEQVAEGFPFGLDPPSLTLPVASTPWE